MISPPLIHEPADTLASASRRSGMRRAGFLPGDVVRWDRDLVCRGTVQRGRKRGHNGHADRLEVAFPDGTFWVREDQLLRD